ncbi:hypothetical protein QQX98_006103 [Neonectria punicea]|uniref:RING-type domain-containing protein n=1 Tax=Neonectria punicea TaxID=979145 RepID=A0ABR1H2P8_9HYPO
MDRPYGGGSYDDVYNFPFEDSDEERRFFASGNNPAGRGASRGDPRGRARSGLSGNSYVGRDASRSAARYSPGRGASGDNFVGRDTSTAAAWYSPGGTFSGRDIRGAQYASPIRGPARDNFSGRNGAQYLSPSRGLSVVPLSPGNSPSGRGVQRSSSPGNNFAGRTTFPSDWTAWGIEMPRIATTGRDPSWGAGLRGLSGSPEYDRAYRSPSANTEDRTPSGRVCAICDDPLVPGEAAFCDVCRRLATAGSICAICEDPIRPNEGPFCTSCRRLEAGRTEAHDVPTPRPARDDGSRSHSRSVQTDPEPPARAQARRRPGRPRGSRGARSRSRRSRGWSSVSSQDSMTGSVEEAPIDRVTPNMRRPVDERHRDPRGLDPLNPGYIARWADRERERERQDRED